MLPGDSVTHLFSVASAILVDINLDHGLKTQVCPGAKLIRKIYAGAKDRTRGNGSRNGMYVSHLKDFKLKRKRKRMAKLNSHADQVWPADNKSTLKT